MIFCLEVIEGRGYYLTPIKLEIFVQLTLDEFHDAIEGTDIICLNDFIQVKIPPFEANCLVAWSAVSFHDKILAR